MSQSHSQSNHELGDRGNWWFDETDTDETAGQTGHAETDGTDAAEYVAFQQIQALTNPICARTKHQPAWNGGRLAELCAWLFDGECIDGRGDQLHREQTEVELTEPEFYCPKQIQRGSRLIAYRQFRLRRRYNPETGYINFGETTATGIPEIQYETYEQAVHNYLWENGTPGREIDTWLAYADRLWHDPTLNSKESLVKFVKRKRRYDEAHRDPGMTPTLPDA